MNKSYLNFRTDMADERVDTYKKVHNLSDIDGISVKTEVKDGSQITVVDVINKNGSEAVKKEIGKYITIELGEVEYIKEETKQSVIKDLASEIKSLIAVPFKSVMIVGLGNSSITPDSLGPKVISFVNITRHIIRYAKELVTEPLNEISAVSPRSIRNYWY